MGEPKIVVVDYHKGNLSSVVRGLARAGAAACTSDDPEQIRNADGLVIPGVGAFYDAIAFMRQSGEEAAVLDAVAAGTPLLGICLGLQLFFERGNEGVPADEGAVADGNTPEPGRWPLGRWPGYYARFVRASGVEPPEGAARGVGPGAHDACRCGRSAARRFCRGRQYVLHPQLCGGPTMPMPPMFWHARTTRGASRASCATATCGAAVPSREILCAGSAHS